MLLSFASARWYMGNITMCKLDNKRHFWVLSRGCGGGGMGGVNLPNSAHE